MRGSLEPVRRVVRMTRWHQWGIVNVVVLDADSSHAEEINGGIRCQG